MPSYSTTVTAVVIAFVTVFLLLKTGSRHLPDTTARIFTTGSRETAFHDGGLEKDIFNSTLGFEKLLVISLPERTDHRDALSLTGALTGIEFQYIDGVDGESVPDRVLPPGGGERLRLASRGSWRAHINAVRSVVEMGWGSAVIFEDDIDWDIRIKGQLYDFARSSQALIQPLRQDVSKYADITFPSPPQPHLQSEGFSFDDLPQTSAPTQSPYGDDWDVLWLGHCGMRRPQPGLVKPWSDIATHVPKGFVFHENDMTVPEPQYIRVFDDPGHPRFRHDFQNHTRVVHHAMDAICSLAYAVTQAGARKILYELAIDKFDDFFDIMLRQFCDGQAGHEKHVCLTVQPTLFDHHRPPGLVAHDSDIEKHEGEDRIKGETNNIRYSARLNVEKLLKGDTDYDDQYPDSTMP